MLACMEVTAWTARLGWSVWRPGASLWTGRRGRLPHLMGEVRHGEGEGNTNTVELLVHLMDIDNNAPVFLAERYEFFLLENSHQFKVPLVVTATDQGNPLAVHC